MYDFAKFLHLVAATVWMGGMAFMLLALRPAAIATLDAPSRARLMGAVWQRFFPVVLVAIVVLFATGSHFFANLVRAARLAGSQGGVPLGWNLMLVMGILMALIFGHIYASGYRRFKRAVAAQEWPVAAQAATQIQWLMATNFILGWLAIGAVRLVR